jgi:hypothetical protein
MRNPPKFLGVCYKYDYKNVGSIFAYQHSNIQQLLHSMGMLEANGCVTPIDPNDNDEKMSEDDAIPIPITPYQSICGQLIWILRTRPDCAYSVNKRCRNMAAPTKKDNRGAKRIARYLKATENLGLTYHPQRYDVKASMSTYCYCDAALDGGRSTSGIALFLGVPDYINHTNRSAAVIFQSKREPTVSQSSMEAELRAIHRAMLACLWMEDYRRDLGFAQNGPSIIFTDSPISIRFLEETGRVSNRTTRHLRSRCLYIKEHITKKRIRLAFVPGALNCADVLTKGLSAVLHKRHCSNLMESVML